MPVPPFETFLTTYGLNGLRLKGCHILARNWIFDDPFHKKIASIGYFSVSNVHTIRTLTFWRKLGFRGCWVVS